MAKIDDSQYVPAAEWDNVAELQAWLDNLDDWFTEIETAFENTVSRDGTAPNTMSGDLNIGDNEVINGTLNEYEPPPVYFMVDPAVGSGGLWGFENGWTPGWANFGTLVENETGKTPQLLCALGTTLYLGFSTAADFESVTITFDDDTNPPETLTPDDATSSGTGWWLFNGTHVEWDQQIPGQRITATFVGLV